MRQYYKDTLDRIDKSTTWFDDYGVPRFGDFSPELLSNVYLSEAALAEVSCQNCGHMFDVALTEAFTSKRFSSSHTSLSRPHHDRLQRPLEFLSKLRRIPDRRRPGRIREQRLVRRVTIRIRRQTHRPVHIIRK